MTLILYPVKVIGTRRLTIKLPSLVFDQVIPSGQVVSVSEAFNNLKVKLSLLGTGSLVLKVKLFFNEGEVYELFEPNEALFTFGT